MSFGKKFMQFCNENVVMITGISIIVAIHWTWAKMQDVPAFVSPEEKKALPIIRGAKALTEMVENKYNSYLGTDSKEK